MKKRCVANDAKDYTEPVSGQGDHFFSSGSSEMKERKQVSDCIYPPKCNTARVMKARHIEPFINLCPTIISDQP